MTLTGWRRFVDARPATFDLLPDEQWQLLTDEARGRYDEARINYHSEMVVVATSTVREVARQGRLLTLLNRREISRPPRPDRVRGCRPPARPPRSSSSAAPTN